MITEEQYQQALKLVKEFTKQCATPVLNSDNYVQTIKYRGRMIEELQECVGYLGYSLNPIGGRPDMFNSMKKDSLEQVVEIYEKIEEIRSSLCDC